MIYLVFSYIRFFFDLPKQFKFHHNHNFLLPFILDERAILFLFYRTQPSRWMRAGVILVGENDEMQSTLRI